MMQTIFGKQYRNYWMGISMVLIMLLHVVYHREASDSIFKILRMMFVQGNVGVNIFFFLSAYGLCYSYKNNNLMSFYQHRIVRLYPMYLIFLIVWLILMGHPLDFTYYLMQVSGLSTFQKPPHVEIWYVQALTVLYVLFPLLYEGIKYLKKHGFIFIWAVIAISSFMYFGVSNYVHGSLWSRLSVIILGIATYLYQNETDGEKKIVTLYALTAALTLFFYNDCEFYFFIPLLLYGLSKTDAAKWPLKKAFSFCGKYSLELYLGQAIGLQYYFVKMEGNFYLDALMCIGISIVAAIGLHFAHVWFWSLTHKTISLCCKHSKN